MFSMHYDHGFYLCISFGEAWCQIVKWITDPVSDEDESYPMWIDKSNPAAYFAFKYTNGKNYGTSPYI